MLKKAFTMLELVMVIVILGIVSSIGADIIANLYENYIKTRAINRLQAQTELVLDQIAKRLTYRIKPSVIARNDGNFSDYVFLPNANNTYKILEWIGKDNEGFRGIKNPGWSGFIDLDSIDTNKTQIKTSGSELNTTNDIIEALSYDTVSLDNPAKKRPAILFKGQSSFDKAQYGWNNVDGNYTIRVSSDLVTANDIIHLDENITEMFEQYDLAWSAYAIVPEGNNSNDFNLTLYYNYQPWEDNNYTDGSKSVLIEHASTFRFTQIGETIRMKLCIHDNNQSGNYDFAFCKERVVF